MLDIQLIDKIKTRPLALGVCQQMSTGAFFDLLVEVRCTKLINFKYHMNQHEIQIDCFPIHYTQYI